MNDERKLGFSVPVRTEDEAIQYLKEQDVMDLLQAACGNDGQYPPVLRDLARLHWLVVTRKVFTVLEFGVGWSTLVLACAMETNKKSWDSLIQKPKIRNSTRFSLHSVDASQRWIENAKRLLPEHLLEYVTVHHSAVSAGNFNGRMCHFYQQIPDVVPDFIYLDGPHPEDVEGSVYGLSWKVPDRTVLAGDLLTMESTLLPGVCVLVDGRTNNARFLFHNLQRRWGIRHDAEEDVTLMELQEPSLGAINKSTLRYSLGDDYFGRL